MTSSHPRITFMFPARILRLSVRPRCMSTHQKPFNDRSCVQMTFPLTGNLLTSPPCVRLIFPRTGACLIIMRTEKIWLDERHSGFTAILQ